MLHNRIYLNICDKTSCFQQTIFLSPNNAVACNSNNFPVKPTTPSISPNQLARKYDYIETYKYVLPGNTLPWKDDKSFVAPRIDCAIPNTSATSVNSDPLLLVVEISLRPVSY